MSAINNVGVVGAGLMGAEIALVCALAGRNVVLSDVSDEAVAKAMDKLGEVMDKGLQRGFYQPGQKEAVLRSIRTSTELAEFGDCDLVIEAVFESEQIKADVFRELDGTCKASTFIASNTSTISITALASYVAPQRRGRFLGTHYFSPVSRMKLVEVIPGIDTTEETVATLSEFCREIGKTPIKVKDVVGFAVNRVLHAFMIEAVRLVEEGVCTPQDLDTACKLGLGHPIGPFELMDLTANSLSLQAQGIMHEAYGERFRPRPLLKQMVRAGYNGKKAGRGWYRYDVKTKG